MRLTASELLELDYPELVKVISSMIEPGLSCRPTAAEGLKSVHEYHDGFTRAQLNFGRCPVRAMFPVALDLLVKRNDVFGPVLTHDFSPMTVPQMVKRTDEANVRQAARTRNAWKPKHRCHRAGKPRAFSTQIISRDPVLLDTWTDLGILLLCNVDVSSLNSAGVQVLSEFYSMPVRYY